MKNLGKTDGNWGELGKIRLLFRKINLIFLKDLEKT